MAKKVCIIRSNPVNPDSRVEKEAWSLKKAGYDVHILAWDRSSDQKEINDFITVAEEKISITRLGHKATYGEGMKNLKSYLAFQFHVRRWLKKNSFDVVHACDFDTAFFSQGVVRRKKEKFIFDIFDFIAGEPKTFFQKMVKKAQLRIINRADATIICTEERKNQISGSRPKRLAVVHNTPSRAQVGEYKFNIEKSDKVKIAYVGILQDYRLLKEILELVSEREDLEFHAGGFGKYEELFCQMSEKFLNIKFYGRLTYEQTLAMERECDIMLAIYDPEIENHRFAAPNKFYESLMLGKPVIMAKNTGMSQVVKENGIGTVIDYSKEGLEQGIDELIANKSEWKTTGEQMRALYENQYCWEEMEKRLLSLYSEVLR